MFDKLGAPTKAVYKDPRAAAGKGDTRRKGADDSAYNAGWDAIFGGKSNETTRLPDQSSTDDQRQFEMRVMARYGVGKDNLDSDWDRALETDRSWTESFGDRA